MTGRPRKTDVERHPSGQIRKPTLAEQAVLDERAAKAIRAVVLAQPHRKGVVNPMQGSALGRFVLDRKLRKEFFTAGEQYAGLVRRLRAVKGVPVPERCGDTGSGDGPSDALVRRWEREEASLRKQLMRLSPFAFVLVRQITLEDREVAPADAPVLIAGLSLLAIEFDLMRAGDHPYA